MEEDNDSMFAEDLDNYEGKWLALVESNGSQQIVASGEDAEEAMREAERKGFSEAYLYRVFPFDQAYVPTTTA
jgi:hypothetical protein